MNYLSLLKGKSFSQICKGVFRYVSYLFTKFKLYVTPPAKQGVSGNKEVKTIVSLTSFPKRIRHVHLCIKTILNQNYKPDAVILWLTKEQFPNGEKELPSKLLKLKRNGLTIQWCNDIRSYKKLIPTLKCYPEAVIITTDDDVYYKKDWLAGLIEAYQRHPDEVCCYRAAKIGFKDGDFIRYPIAPGSDYHMPTYLHQQTGVGGVLYPPHTLYKDILREDIFMDIANTNDDLWFWFMGVLQGTPVRIINNNTFNLYFIGDTQLYSLTSINDHGEQLYDKQLQNLFKKYPQVLEKLKFAYSDIQSSATTLEV